MITHVAIRHNGKIYSLPKPNRHHDVIRMIWEQTGEQVHAELNYDQGFLDDQGTYYHRRAALAHAAKHKQLIARATCEGNRLYSEDVW